MRVRETEAGDSLPASLPAPPPTWHAGRGGGPETARETKGRRQGAG